MSLQTEIFGDVTVVHTPEELGAEHCDHFAASFAELDRRNVVFDLDMTETIDSKGLACLLDIQDHLRDLGGEAKIATTNANNRKILEITRLDQQIEVFDNIIDAVKSFQ